jgi:hypothetical protein
MTALFVPYCGVDSTRLLLEHGADPNHIDQSGSTPLMQAVEWMMRRKAGLLIDAGADVSVRSGDGRYVIDFVRANSWGCDHLWPMYDTLLAGGADAGRFVKWLLAGLRDHALCTKASIMLRKLGREYVSRYADVPSQLRRLKEFVGTAETLPYGCVLKEAAEQSLAVLESSSYQDSHVEE